MPDDSHQNAVGTGIAQALGEGAHATVNITGFTSEQIAPLLQAAGAAAQARIDELAGQLNTSSEAARGFLSILREDDVPTEQLSAKLTLIAQRYVGMLDRLAALDPEDVDARGYIDEAREGLGRADSTKEYDRADALLSKAEEAQERTLQRAEDLEHEAHEAVGHLRRRTAATRAERGELSLTRLDYLQAAQHFKSAAALVVTEDLNLKLGYLARSADALKTHGDEKGDNAILAEAIGVYRDVLCERIRDRGPQDWATTQNDLGVALLILGERESDTGRMEEAVSAFSEALKGYTRERVPLRWATTQNNLGGALLAIGGERVGRGGWRRH
jgi:tetratricopeptide (TPR) repeat protein